MTENLADSDIDKFIRDQKSRLALEKRELNDEEEYQRTTRKRWAEPDKENFNFGDKKEPDTRPDLLRPETPVRQGYPLDNRQVIKQRKQLSEQRKHEYNDYLKSHTNNRRKPRNLTPTQKSIQVGNPNDRRKEELNTERRNDYNEHLNREKRKPRNLPGRKNLIPESRRVPYEPRPQERKFYDLQLKYSDEMPQNVDLQLKLELDSPEEFYPVETDTPKGASLPIGQYEIQRKEQAPEIKRRYRADLEKQLREKERLNRNRSGNKQKLDYGKARQGPKLDTFKKQMRVQGSPRKSAEKFGDMRKPPTDYRSIETFTEYNNSQSKHRFKNQYDYEQWQRKQISALNDIDRRQHELRLKLERDQTIRELEGVLLPQEEYDIDIQTKKLLEKNRSPSPHVDPPLYDPIEADQLRQSARDSPERLLIPDNLTKEKAEKLRRERQHDYQEMMAQKQHSPRRLFDQEDQAGWGIFGEGNFLESLKKPKAPKLAVITSPQKNGGVRTWREPSREEILLDDKQDVLRKKLEEERKNEYNEYLKKKNTRGVTWKDNSFEDKGSPPKRQSRQPNDNPPQPLQKGDKTRKEWREISKEDLLIKDSNDRKTKLAEERKNEYKQLLESKPNKNREWNNSEDKPLLSDREDKKKQLQQRRQQEYNDLQKNLQNTRNNELPRPGTPGGFLNKLGSHDRQRQKLKDERHEEYKRLQAEKMGFNQDFSDPRMLLAKDSEIYATLPGMNYHGSATRREKAEQRNKDYNKIKPFIDSPRSGRGENEPPGAPRKGWGTPTYEEMLEKKRNEEQKYRRLNDPDYTRPGMKSYNSESALHRLEDEKRLKDILQSETKKSNILSNGILEDPDWLRQKNRPDPDRAYSHLLERLKNWNDDFEAENLKAPRPDSRQKTTPNKSSPAKQDNDLPPRGRGVQAVHEYPPRGIRDAPTYLPESNKHRFYATLPVGQEDRDELQKRKEEYKQELMRQMKEAEEARKKNKQDFIEPALEKQQQAPPGQRVIIIPNKQLPDVVPPQQQQQQQQYQQQYGIDRLSPRSEMLLGRTRDLERLERRLKKIEHQNAAINPLDIAELDFISKRDPRTQIYPPNSYDHGGSGILEQGFDRLLEPPKVGSVKVPVGLEYTPSTYVTGGDNFDKFSSVDKAYHYYGSHNPLDTGLPAPTQIAASNYGSVPTGNQTVVDNYRAAHGGGGLGGGGGYSSPVLGQPSAAAIQESINQGSDAERKAYKRAQAQQYQRELERQVEEKKLKQVIAREEKERYERKLEDDIRNYNPFGRGGAGAPMKDEYGNVVANLRTKNNGNSPRYEPMSSPTRAGPRPTSPSDDLIKTPPAQTTAEGESTYARGGHGIFGHPKTEAEKSQADRYKEELKRQIDNKKREAQLEKERERKEEERQQKIIDDQRKKMQEEYDEEKRRIQAKQDEQDRKNAEIVKLQEDQKVKEKELRGEKKNIEEGRLEYERQRQEREEKERGKSPPIHALRKPNTEDNDSESKDKDVENKRVDKNQEDDRKTPKSASLSSKPTSPVNQPKSPPIPAINQSRGKSPPVPAIKTKQQETPPPPTPYDYRNDSPLLPTLRHRNLDVYTDNGPPARNNSADVLNQLAHMRRQLQSERKRVENMLEETRNEPDVFDPRLVQRPPQQQIQSQVQSRNDIFETALNRNAVQVRRGGTADMKILQEFDDLKHKENTDSRKHFRKLYPVDPRTQDDLESQQSALIRQQEERLRRLVDSPIDLPGTSNSPQTMLHSNSAFIDVEGMDRNLFPDDFDDFPKRNESARDRRRQREADRYPSKSPRDTSTDLPPNYNPMGSVVSLDVDRIQRKNDHRLKRLKEIQGDDVSLYDPDDVINRFMEKQSHNRPPSNNTLHDDSWLLPGNKNKRY